MKVAVEILESASARCVAEPLASVPGQQREPCCQLVVASDHRTPSGPCGPQLGKLHKTELLLLLLLQLQLQLLLLGRKRSGGHPELRI